ncbi:class I SAM-dependent methyltransferase [Henriciella barbarensis]|uniref:Class I SAM-dependent methyltransferase n=1 Tax=Henriciella barbarensis TaxID=86342 RepID=A0A399QWM9_9PROT|nr:class I SAM-dependent methyltransferase [Henriciella barbarensis]RIJ23476.1 class I SAM-dependent methyltransferase [Henriciella barbarensis]
MSDANEIRAQQKSHWDGAGGEIWVDAQSVMDAMFEVIESRLAASAARSGASRILDIGCGTGAVTLAAARAASSAHLTGIDISGPMLALARRRASAAGMDADFIKADAEAHDFSDNRFGLMISRFGVMFFADPVKAFSNLRSAAEGEAELHLYAWRSPADNPFMSAGTRAAAPFLDEMPKREKNAPGQFGFEDRDYVHTILKDAGWTGIDIKAEDIPCSFPVGELPLFLDRLGPVPRLLDMNPQADRDAVRAAVRQAYEAFIVDDEVRYTAGCWAIRAKAPA